jgi:nitrate reductase NapAB chaperone NapD
MNISGILVQAAPEHFEDVLAAIAALAGVEIHHREAQAGRAVVTIEAADTEAEMAMLRRIQDLPQVAMAELVYHYFEEETAQAATQRSAEVPGRLRR